jgi:hypothetical protein
MHSGNETDKDNIYRFPEIEKKAAEVDNTNNAEPEKQILVLESTIALAIKIHKSLTPKLEKFLKSFFKITGYGLIVFVWVIRKGASFSYKVIHGTYELIDWVLVQFATSVHKA